MNLLVDACAGRRLAQALRASGHDVVFVGEWSEDPGDDEILARAHAENRVVVTRDKDFGTLAVRDRRPHCGIVRLLGLSPRAELAVCQAVLGRHHEALGRGAHFSHFFLSVHSIEETAGKRQGESGRKKLKTEMLKAEVGPGAESEAGSGKGDEGNAEKLTTEKLKTEHGLTAV